MTQTERGTGPIASLIAGPVSDRGSCCGLLAQGALWISFVGESGI